MRNELTIIQNMETTIESHINEFLPSGTPALASENVQIAFPDTDRMPKDVMIYLAPSYAEQEPLATRNDRAKFTVSVYLVCKRDTASNLTLKTYAYYNALYTTLKTYQNLDGAADLLQIPSTEFYPAIDMNPNVQGAELSVAVEYTKDF